jgi:hypothetical protein
MFIFMSQDQIKLLIPFLKIIINSILLINNLLYLIYYLFYGLNIFFLQNLFTFHLLKLFSQINFILNHIIYKYI